MRKILWRWKRGNAERRTKEEQEAGAGRRSTSGTQENRLGSTHPAACSCSCLLLLFFHSAIGLELLDEPIAQSFGDCFRFRVNLELFVDVSHVEFDGVYAHIQFLS